MHREPYAFAQRGAAVDQAYFHAINLGERLVALAAGRDLRLDVCSAGPRRWPSVICVRVTAVGVAGGAEVLGEVYRPMDGLRDRLALSIAIARDARAAKPRKAA